MAKGSLGGRRGALNLFQAPTSNVPGANASPLTDADADAIRKQEDSAYDANTTAAVKMYISNTNFDGKGHSLSQAMNYALDEGVDWNQPLSQINAQLGTNFTANDIASMQYTDAYLQAAAHPIGRDVVLQRGAHDDVLKKLGIANYERFTEAQLQQKLAGKTIKTTSFMSTSYDVTKNPFLSSASGVSGGREVVLNIKAGAQTRCVFGAKKQSEIVLAKGTDFVIKRVRYTGNTVTPRGGRSRRQIVIDIETY